MLQSAREDEVRYRQISIFEASRGVEAPFALHALTDVDEYGCFLFRCEGTVPFHRHLTHDELFWPLDRPIRIRGEGETMTVAPDHLVRVRRGWRHSSAAVEAAHVLLFSRGERSHTLNGHFDDAATAPPEEVAPMERLRAGPPNEPHFLLQCDQLHLFGERVVGSGPSRMADGDVLVVPLRGTVGLRCGGMVAVVEQGEIARLPAGSGWHLFGESEVIWATTRREPTPVDG